MIAMFVFTVGFGMRHKTAFYLHIAADAELIADTLRAYTEVVPGMTTRCTWTPLFVAHTIPRIKAVFWGSV
jgi:hypothetical protein